MKIVTIAPDDTSRRNFAAHYSRLERRRGLLVRRQIPWDIRKADPQRAQKLCAQLAMHYQQVALSYMRSL